MCIRDRLERTPFGRHMYAVGGNPEAARRAGINVPRVRTLGFVLCSATAGIAGIIYCSQLGGMTTNIAGGQLVLYAVAAAVIGGTAYRTIWPPAMLVVMPPSCE